MTDAKAEPTSMDEWREANRLEREQRRQEMRLCEESAKRDEAEHAERMADIPVMRAARERQVVAFERIADALERLATAAERNEP